MLSLPPPPPTYDVTFSSTLHSPILLSSSSATELLDRREDKPNKVIINGSIDGVREKTAYNLLAQFHVEYLHGSLARIY